jgi:alpha-L-rhamnosidase
MAHPGLSMPVAGAGLADAAVVLPWVAWWHGGDTTVIDAHWDAMARYLGWVEASNPEALVATAYWARNLALAADMATATGRDAAYQHYRSLHRQVASAFAREFVHDDGRVRSESATGCILALAFGLVPAHLVSAAADQLAQAVREAEIEGEGEGLLHTGLVGASLALDVLAEQGHADLVVRLLLGTGMRAPAAIGSFVTRRVAGIDNSAPGFAQLRVAPLLDPRLGAGRAHHDGPRGRIETGWGFAADGSPWFELTLPTDTHAEVCLPWMASSPPTLAQAGHHRFELKQTT